MRLPWMAAALTLVVIAPANAYDLRSQTRSYSVAGARRVSLELPPGEVTVTGSDDAAVRVTVSIHCDGSQARCERRAQKLELDQSLEGGTLSIQVHDRNHGWHGDGGVRTEVTVPRALAMTLAVGAGEVDIVDTGGDVHLNLGAGEATLRLRDSDVNSVHARVGVGEVSLRARGRDIDSGGFISRTLEWSSGHGAAHVHVTVGAGEVDVRVD